VSDSIWESIKEYADYGTDAARKVVFRDRQRTKSYFDQLRKSNPDKKDSIDQVEKLYMAELERGPPQTPEYQGLVVFPSNEKGILQKSNVFNARKYRGRFTEMYLYQSCLKGGKENCLIFPMVLSCCEDGTKLDVHLYDEVTDKYDKPDRPAQIRESTVTILSCDDLPNTIEYATLIQADGSKEHNVVYFIVQTYPSGGVGKVVSTFCSKEKTVTVPDSAEYRKSLGDADLWTEDKSNYFEGFMIKKSSSKLLKRTEIMHESTHIGTTGLVIKENKPKVKLDPKCEKMGLGRRKWYSRIMGERPDNFDFDLTPEKK
jgi:hypothetical protein